MNSRNLRMNVFEYLRSHNDLELGTLAFHEVGRTRDTSLALENEPQQEKGNLPPRGYFKFVDPLTDGDELDVADNNPPELFLAHSSMIDIISRSFENPGFENHGFFFTHATLEPMPVKNVLETIHEAFEKAKFTMSQIRLDLAESSQDWFVDDLEAFRNNLQLADGEVSAYVQTDLNAATPLRYHLFVNLGRTIGTNDYKDRRSDVMYLIVDEQQTVFFKSATSAVELQNVHLLISATPLFYGDN